MIFHFNTQTGELTREFNFCKKKKKKKKSA